MTRKPKKTVSLNLRVREDVRADIAVVAELRGLTVTGLINSYLVRLIREDKEKWPQYFETASNVQEAESPQLGEVKKLDQARKAS